MYSPLHAAAGVLLAATIPHPLIGLPLAVASHYLLDAVPHGDMRKPHGLDTMAEGRRLALTELIDLPLAGVVVWHLVTVFPATSTAYLLAGVIASILPDLLWGGLFLLNHLGWKIPILTPALAAHHRWHEHVHIKKTQDIPFLAGVAYHLVVIIGLLLL